MTYRNIEKKLLMLLIVAGPIILWPYSYDEFRSIRETYFQIIGLGVFLCMASRYFLLSPSERVDYFQQYRDLGVGKYAIALLLISSAAYGISFIFNEHTVHGARTLINFIIGVILLMSFVAVISVDRYAEWLKIYSIPVFINVFLGIAQYFGFDPFFESLDPEFHSVYKKYRVAGLLDSSNMFAPFVSCLVPFLFLKMVYAKTWSREFFLYLVSLAVILLPVALSRNFGGIVALGIVMIFLLIVLTLNSKRGGIEFSKLILVWILFVGTAVIFTNQIIKMDSDSVAIKKWSMQERMNQYEVSYNMFLESPIIGKGPGYFFRHFVEYRREVWFSKPPQVLVTRSAHQAHNDFLQFLGEGGLISTIPLLGAIGIILYVGLLHLKAFVNGGDRSENKIAALASLSGFIILNINAMVNFPYHVAPLAVSSIFFGALFLKTAATGGVK